jgi:hypothetical protein
MPIASKGVIAIPDSAASSFDRGAFEPVTRFADAAKPALHISSQKGRAILLSE